MRAKAPASLRSVIAVACLVMPSGVLAVAQLELSLLPSRNQDFAQMVAFLQPDYRSCTTGREVGDWTICTFSRPCPWRRRLGHCPRMRATSQWRGQPLAW